MNNVVGVIVLALAGFLLNLPIVFIAGMILFWLFLASFSSPAKPILAFDYSGVITKGDFFTEPIKVNTEMKDIVSKLRKKYKTVVVTNDNALPFNLASKHFSTNELFDKKFVSSEIGYQKPDKRFYQKVLEQLNARPEEVIYIDDKPEYTREASKLGIKSITFKSSKELVNELAKHGVTA